MDKQIKWVEAETSVVADLNCDDWPYCLGFNADWPSPKVRVGWYDGLDRDTKTGTWPFRLVGERAFGEYDRPNPTHLARIPDYPVPKENK